MKAKRGQRENAAEKRPLQRFRTSVSDLKIAPTVVHPATRIPDRKRRTPDKFPQRNIRHGNVPRPVRQI